MIWGSVMICRLSIALPVQLALMAIAMSIPALAAPSAAAPAIRITEQSRVPACVTPDRLMSFMIARNDKLDPKFRVIAQHYKKHGEFWRVRWDYAFYQMLIETNYLTFRRGDGKPGDVTIKQNNFAGLGTTGGGVPGDSYPDVNTGVLAQIQHLVVYSGERIAAPVGARTRLKQDDILSASAPVSTRRPVTYQDLSGRWAVDRSYGRSIESIAERFKTMFCSGRDEAVAKAVSPTPQPKLAVRNIDDAKQRSKNTPAPIVPATTASTEALVEKVAATGPAVVLSAACKVQLASYGGRKAILIRAVVEGETHYTALGVLDGFERDMSESFVRSHAPGGSSLGEFASREAALERAYELCPQRG